MYLDNVRSKNTEVVFGKGAYYKVLSYILHIMNYIQILHYGQCTEYIGTTNSTILLEVKSENCTIIPWLAFSYPSVLHYPGMTTGYKLI